MTSSETWQLPSDGDLDRLRCHLADDARRASLVSTPSSSIVRRAERRIRRKRISLIAGAVSAVAALTAVGGLITRADDPRHQVVPVEVVAGTEAAAAETSVTTVATTTPIASTTTPPAQWTAHDLGPAPSVTSIAGNGPLVRWSRDVRAASDFVSDLQVSSDGVNWATAPASHGISIIAATASSGTIAVLGYVPTDLAEEYSAVLVKLSDDGGSTWRTLPLPTEFPLVDGEPGVAGGGPAASLAIDGSTVIASFGMQVILDPQLLTTEQNMQTQQYSPDGIELLKPCEATPCDPSATGSVAVVPWSDVGISHRVVDAILRTPKLYTSTAGQPFDAVTDGPVSGGYNAYSVVLAHTRNGFLALTSENTAKPSGALWQSNDGFAWSKIGTVPVTDTFDVTIGTVGDFYTVTTSAGRPWLSRNGVDWQQSDLGGLLSVQDGQGDVLPNVSVVDASGITFVAQITQAPTGDVDIVRDGVIERFSGGGYGPITFYDQATGAELGQVVTAPFDNGVVISKGDGKIDILDGNDSVRATFTVDDLTTAVNTAAAKQPPTQVMILHSANGVAWSSVSVNDITGGRPGEVRWVKNVGGVTSIGVIVESTDLTSTRLVVLTSG
jgi:hypothetical protein